MPAVSISKDTIASSAMFGSEITGGLAAVTEVVSPESTVSFVLRIVTPDSLISIVTTPALEAPKRDARMPVMVIANGARKYALLTPTVSEVIKSERLI